MPPRPRRARFDVREVNIPQNLRERIEGWQDNIPSTQFQQYGPINRYLNLKFDHEDHMVKPQALFRSPLDPHEDELLLQWGTNPDDSLPDIPEDAQAVEDLRVWVEKGDISIDSTHDGFIDKRVKKDYKVYPDFVVCTFVPNPREEREKDRVLIVLEIASLPRGKDIPDSEVDSAKLNVLEQLEKYMNNFMRQDGDRWDDIVVGIALLGIEVAFLEPNKDGDVDNPWRHYRKGRQGQQWFSLYGSEFLKFVNKARNH